jgi:hypothetical protein
MTDEPETCPLCRGIGWVLEGDPTRTPLTAELDECPHPGCADSGRAIEALAIRGRFRRAIVHPVTRAVMSLTGAAPAWNDDTTSATPAGSVPAGVETKAEDLRRRARANRRILPPGARPTGPR